MIKEIGNEMKSFVSDLKKNITNKDELKYILDRTDTLFDCILRDINKYVDEEERKYEELRDKQKKQDKRMDEIEAKMDYLEENLDNIYKDIYDEEEGEFKITCPYCNNEFSADIDENEIEIFCPECNNSIELDWGENIEK